MKLVSLFLLHLAPVICFSQQMTVQRPDKQIDPDPYTQVYYADVNDYTNIAEISLTVKDRNNGFVADTLNKQYFNSNGDKTKEVRYSKNVPSKNTVYTYYPNGDLYSWELVDLKYSTMTFYTYSSDRKISHTRQLRVKKRNGQTDSTLLNTFSFTYDGENLIEIMSSNSPVETYEFTEKQLISKKGGYISKSFQYDDNTNLLELNEFMGGQIVDSMRMGVKIFTYDKSNKLIADSILTSANLEAKKYQITHYTYQAGNDLLETANVTYDGFYRNISFEYADNKVKTMTVSTNRSNSAYLRMWLNHTIANYYSFPIEYVEKFDYDKRGNRISKKAYVNNELFSEIEYHIRYEK